MTLEISTPECPTVECPNSESEPVPLTSEQQKEVDQYLQKHSTPLPLVGPKWRVVFRLAEIIAKEGQHHRWLNIHTVVDIAIRNKVDHFGNPLDYFDLVEILKAAFCIDQLIWAGPYQMHYRREEVSRNGKKTLEHEYCVEVDCKALAKYEAFLGSISGVETLEVQNK